MDLRGSVAYVNRTLWQSKAEWLDSQLLFTGLAIARHRDPNSLTATRLAWIRAIVLDFCRAHPVARRSPTFVDKSLKGLSPTDLPIEQPTRFSHRQGQKCPNYDKTMSLSGAPLPNRVGILQFANVDAVKGWWNGGGRDIQEKVGNKYADIRIFAVEGVQQ